MKITGHAAPFNSLSLDLGGFREKIRPGAFSRTIRDGHPIFAVHHHHYGNLLGSTQGRTLSLSEDDRGLYFEIELPDTSLGRDVHALVKRGDLASMSFSFLVNGARGERWYETDDDKIERELLDVDLLEISTVALPAYRASKVSARSAVSVDKQGKRNQMLKRQMQARLRAVG